METKLVYYEYMWNPNEYPHRIIIQELILLLSTPLELFQGVSSIPIQGEYMYTFTAKLVSLKQTLKQERCGLGIRELVRRSPTAFEDSDSKLAFSYKVSAKFNYNQQLTDLMNEAIKEIRRKKNEVSLEGKCEDMRGVILPHYEDLVKVYKDKRQIGSVVETTLKKFHKVIKNK